MTTTLMSLLFVLLTLSFTNQAFADEGCDGYDPNSAKLPTGKGCKQPKQVIKYDPNCARLNGCDDKTNPGVSGSQKLAVPKKEEKKKLLLPAVQAAREAARRTPNQLPKPDKQSFSMGGDNQQHAGPDTGAASCESVSACNEMIATCIALGGNTTATSYDPDTGAPNGAVCFSPAE